MPRETSTRGTTQHSDAPRAAAAPVRSAQRGEFVEGEASMAASYILSLSTESSGLIKARSPMTTSNPFLHHWRLAAAAGVHVETIRYYQRRGLVAQPTPPRGSV